MIHAATNAWRDRVTASWATPGGTVGWALVLIGAALWWLCTDHLTWVPFWLPWDFSPLWYAGFAFGGFSYVRGLLIVPQARWRLVVVALGAGLIWTVVQTRFEYLALHQFFYNRLQHMIMHHLGAFLIALGWPWQTIVAGMPAPARQVVEHRWFRRAITASRQPEVAGVAFVGLLALWLTPSVHLSAMLSPVLYPVMNWSMVLDGLLFWSLVLDPRPPAQAGVSFVARAVLGVVVMFPQIAMGAYLCFADRDLYPFYTWCGRLYPTIDALMDQRIGGVVVWESPGMMSVFTLILVLNAKRRYEESIAPKREGAVSSARWTGR